MLFYCRENSSVFQQPLNAAFFLPKFLNQVNSSKKLGMYLCRFPYIHFHFFMTKAHMPSMELVCAPLSRSCMYVFMYVSTKLLVEWYVSKRLIRVDDSPARMSIVIRWCTSITLVQLGTWKSGTLCDLHSTTPYTRRASKTLLLVYFLLALNMESSISMVFSYASKLIQDQTLFL